MDAGRAAIRFTNATTSGEMHELVLMRRNDGTTESVEELMALGDGVMDKLTMTGVAFADAAGTESVLLTDLEPGGYIAICMIPVGGGETGDPHAAHGMVAELEVTRDGPLSVHRGLGRDVPRGRVPTRVPGSPTR